MKKILLTFIVLTSTLTVNAANANTLTKCNSLKLVPELRMADAGWEELIDAAKLDNSLKGFKKVVSVAITQTNEKATACVISESNKN